VKIERLDIDAFGKLSAFDGKDGPLPSLVVVLGPNEAGKSTVFEFLTTMLYGFSPASRELNPFVPWGGDEARGSLGLRLHDGRTATVTRRLRSQPAAQLEIDGDTTDLRNHPLPWVEHVPRTVFRQVFAVTLGELASLDEETWGRIQDRVVGSMGASDLKAVRGVAAELEREAGELWRPNRRGNQKIRDARDRMRDLRARRRDAVSRDRELRARVDELDRARQTLKARRERRAADQVVVEHAQLLLPVRAQMERIAGLRREAGPEELLADLPAAPHERLTELRKRVDTQEEALRKLRQERVLPERAVAELTPAVRSLLDHRDEIIRYVSSVSRTAANRARAADLREEIATLDARLDRVSRDLVDRPWTEAPRERLLELTPAAVRVALDRLERARARTGRSEPTEPAPGPGGFVAGLGLLVAGLALTAWAGMTGAALLTALGAAAATGGGAVAWSAGRARRSAEAAGNERRAREQRTEGELREALAAFEAVVRGAGLAERHLHRPESSVVEALERLHELAEQRRGRTRALEDAASRVESAAREGRAIAARIGIEGADADGPEELAAVFSDRLRAAERTEQAAEAAKRELAGLDRREESERRALDEARQELEALEGAARRFGEGKPEEALRLAANRMEALDRARTLELELERNHPDLPAIRRRIEQAEREGARWLTDEKDLGTRRARVQQLSDEIEELEGTTRSLEKEIELARGCETADQVDGEIATLEADTEAMIRERDRKWILARLLREADRSFREEHQPDLMRRASGHLAHLTNQRYDRILVEETDESDLFRISGPAIAGPIPLRHPISTGTLEQAYLSLRLAIVDHLDQGAEPLPLFVDEVFVNWDAERRTQGLEVLARLAERRQVFLFTCHPYMARELEEAGARVVELAR
jgi:uncharacterized protein YhaN